MKIVVNTASQIPFIIKKSHQIFIKTITSDFQFSGIDYNSEISVIVLFGVDLNNTCIVCPLQKKYIMQYHRLGESA